MKPVFLRANLFNETILGSLLEKGVRPGTITVMIIAILAMFGIILGSFVNALVWRLHEQAALKEARGKKSKAQSVRASQTSPFALSPNDLSITKGRSMCPQCHHTLAPKDLVPVLSWLSLKGKCRYCHQPISWQYPVVELLTGALYAGSYLAWPTVLHGIGLFQFALWLAFLVGFVALAVYDLHWFTLPDRLVLPLLGLAVAQMLVLTAWLHSFAALWQPALAALIIFGIFWGLFQVSDGAWIGGGDVKLAPMLGLLVATPLRVFLVIFFASLLGTLVSIPLLARGKQGLKVHIPFGPYLLLATVLVVLFGHQLVSAYEKLFLL